MQEIRHDRLKSEYSMVSNTTQQFAEQIECIDKVLSEVCCHHDSLMPIFEITNYLPSLQRWETQMKSLEKKVHQHTTALECILKPQTPQFIEENGKSLDQMNISFNKIRNRLETSAQSLRKIENNLQQSSSLFQTFEKTPQTKLRFQKKLIQNDRYVQTCLASFKNEIELQKEITLQNEGRDGKLRQDHNLGLINETIKNEIFAGALDRSLQNLLREIEMLKAELPPLSDILKFHEFNCNRIGCELVELDCILQNLFKQFIESTPKDRNTGIDQFTSRDKAHGFSVIYERVQFMKWQLSGMRKKYLRYLSDLYVQNTKRDCSQIQALQGKFVHDLSCLSKRVQILHQKVDKIKQQLP